MTRSIAVFVFPGFEILDFAATTVFEVANRHCIRHVYALRLYSAQGGSVRSASGAHVDTLAWRDAAGVHDTVMALGRAPEQGADGMLGLLRQACAQARRSVSIGMGAQAMAQAGLLEGLRVAVGARDAPALQAGYPGVKFDGERAYLRDGRHWSCAGMTVAIDCMLALVEDDLGVDIALDAARCLYLYNWRCEADVQQSALLALTPRCGRIRKALGYARQNLRLQLTIGALADQANMSARHFTRIFRAETGQSPARAIEAMRAEVARGLLEGSTLSMGSIARESGFTGPEQMRTALSRVYRQTPQALRRNAAEA